MFGEPARAISRNVIIIAIGFLPMLVASLVPYKTTGLLLFSILTISGFVTLVLLPAILTIARERLFRARRFRVQDEAGTPRTDPVPALARIGSPGRDGKDGIGRQ